jgi:hypothetical protein
MKQLYLFLALGGLSSFAGGARAQTGEPGTGVWLEFPALENGDSNADGLVDLTDAIYIFQWLFLGGPEMAPVACPLKPAVLRNGDLNGDRDIDVSDPITLIRWLYSGGRAPAPSCEGGLIPDLPGGGGQNLNPRILPPGASAYGKSYGEWSAAWWQWALAMPVSANPLFDTADCDAGQSGKVWFLGGAFTGSATTRHCDVPAGKAIFVPIANVECSTVEPPPFFGANEAELRACAKAFQDGATGMLCTVDGREITGLDGYRVQSPLFDFSAPADNALFIPGPVSGQSISDGVWLLLAPLSAGEHTIHFEAFPGFPLNVTYILTVG